MILGGVVGLIFGMFLGLAIATVIVVGRESADDARAAWADHLLAKLEGDDSAAPEVEHD